MMIACLELSAALIKLYRFIMQKRQNLLRSFVYVSLQTGERPPLFVDYRTWVGVTLLFRQFDINTCIFFPFVIVSIKKEKGSIFLAFGFPLSFQKRYLHYPEFAY